MIVRNLSKWKKNFTVNIYAMMNITFEGVFPDKSHINETKTPISEQDWYKKRFGINTGSR